MTRSPTPLQQFEDLLDTYWSCAHAEGAAQRTHDTPEGTAQATLSALRALFQAQVDAAAQATRLAGEVADFMAAAADAIPAAEHPKDPTPSNWAWQVRTLGADRRVLLTELHLRRAQDTYDGTDIRG